MTTRRDVLKLGTFGSLGALGAVGSLGLAGTKGGEDPPPPVPITPLAPQNTPVPYAAPFRRPPELLPYATGFDDGDPLRPFAKFALIQKLGQAQILPGLSTTVAGYNGIFPGPTIRARQGTRIEVRMRNGFPAAGLLHPKSFRTVTHLHGSASLPQYDGYANDFTARATSRTTTTPTGRPHARCGTTTTTTT